MARRASSGLTTSSIKLDLNDDIACQIPTVFTLIGSSKRECPGLKVIKARYKGKDLIDRISEQPEYYIEIPPLEIGDGICVYVSKVLEHYPEGLGITHLEKMAVFYTHGHDSAPKPPSNQDASRLCGWSHKGRGLPFSATITISNPVRPKTSASGGNTQQRLSHSLARNLGLSNLVTPDDGSNEFHCGDFKGEK